MPQVSKNDLKMDSKSERGYRKKNAVESDEEEHDDEVSARKTGVRETKKSLGSFEDICKVVFHLNLTKISYSCYFLIESSRGSTLSPWCFF